MGNKPYHLCSCLLDLLVVITNCLVEIGRFPKLLIDFWKHHDRMTKKVIRPISSTVVMTDLEKLIVTNSKSSDITLTNYRCWVMCNFDHSNRPMRIDISNRRSKHSLKGTIFVIIFVFLLSFVTSSLSTMVIAMKLWRWYRNNYYYIANQLTDFDVQPSGFIVTNDRTIVVDPVNRNYYDRQMTILKHGLAYKFMNTWNYPFIWLLVRSTINDQCRLHLNEEVEDTFASNITISCYPVIQQLKKKFKSYMNEYLSNRWSRALSHANVSVETSKSANNRNTSKPLTDNNPLTESNTTETETTTVEDFNEGSQVDKIHARVYDPLMPYPEEYPEEYQTIQNGPAIIISRTTYTRIPNVTYTTITTVTLPTYKLLEKAENGFMSTLFDRRRKRQFQ